MLIQILQKREGGTDVPFGSAERGDLRVYKFRANDKDDHVCEVAEEFDAARFVAIPEGFVEYDPNPKPVVIVAPTPPPADPYAFLDALAGEELEDFAFSKLHAKLDETHDDAKRREYIKGVLKLKE